MTETLHTIHLHGSLRKFGESFKFAVNSPAEAAQFLLAQIDGFAEAIREGTFRLVRGDAVSGMEDDENTLFLTFGKKSIDYHFIPVVSGAGGGGGGGTGKIIIGAVIMAAAIIAAPFTGGTSIAAAIAAGSFSFGVGVGGFIASTAFAIGAAIALSGIAQVMQPAVSMPKVGGYTGAEQADQRPSFLMNSPVNMMEQGGAIPILYGRFVCGSNVINGSLLPEAMPA